MYMYVFYVVIAYYICYYIWYDVNTSIVYYLRLYILDVVCA